MRGAGRWAAIAAIAIGLSGCVDWRTEASNADAQLAESQSTLEAENSRLRGLLIEAHDDAASLEAERDAATDDAARARLDAAIDAVEERTALVEKQIEWNATALGNIETDRERLKAIIDGPGPDAALETLAGQVPYGGLVLAAGGLLWREVRNRNILKDVVGSIDAAKRADSDFADAFDRNAATIGSVQDKRTRKAVASVRSGA